MVRRVADSTDADRDCRLTIKTEIAPVLTGRKFLACRLSAAERASLERVPCSSSVVFCNSDEAFIKRITKGPVDVMVWEASSRIPRIDSVPESVIRRGEEVPLLIRADCRFETVARLIRVAMSTADWRLSWYEVDDLASDLEDAVAGRGGSFAYPMILRSLLPRIP